MFKLASLTEASQYESRQRSIRIHGVITSIRLENAMWEVLSDIAVERNCTTNALISSLYDELTESRSEVSNFASFLRVTCVCHLVARGQRVPAPPRLHRAPVDADAIAAFAC
jgi:predicted DNA-binding ribbon-helix-helix protein